MGSVFIGLALLAQYVASAGPEMLCHKLKMALGTAVIGDAAKCTAAKATPKPEFCIPTSMAMALLSA